MGIVEGSVLWYLCGFLAAIWVTYALWKEGTDITAKIILQNLATAALGPALLVACIYSSGILDKAIIKGKKENI